MLHSAALYSTVKSDHPNDSIIEQTY